MVRSNFTFDADFSGVSAELTKLSRQATFINSQFATLNKEAAALKMTAARSFAGQAGFAGFKAQIVDLTGATEQFGQQLMKNKLTMREYFREAAQAYKKDSKARALAEREVRRAQSQVVGVGDVGGRRKGVLLTPETLDMGDRANKIAVANKQYEIFNDLIQKGSTSMVNWGKNTQWAGRQLTVGLTVPIGIFSAQAIKAFAELDKEVTRFRKVYGSDLSGSVEGATDQMVQDIQTLGDEFARQFGIASSQTMALAADLAATGLEGQKLAAAVTQTTRLMVLGEVDRQQAMKATLSIQSAFKQSSKELAESVDFLNAVENSTSASLQDLTEAIPKTGPVIQALGGDIKDLSVLMTALREGGIAAGEGANAIKSGMASLISPTNKAIEVAKQFGVDLKGIVTNNKGELMPMLLEFQDQLRGLDDFGKARVIESVFGKYQFARISALFANLNQQGSQTVGMVKLLDASSDELAKKAYSELQQQANAPSTRLAAAQQQLQQNLIKVGAELAESLLPILEKGLEFLQGLVDGFNNLPGPIKGFVKILGGIAAASGPILMLAGIFGNLIGNTIKFGMNIINMFKKITGNPVKQLSILTDEELAAKVAANQLTGAYDRQKASVQQLTIALEGYIANLREAAAVAPPGAFAPSGRRGPRPMPKRFNSGGQVFGPMSKDGRLSGYGGGDTVPAMLEPGEFVINKKSSQKYKGLLTNINQGKDIPGYNTAGEVSEGGAVPGTRSNDSGVVGLKGTIDKNPNITMADLLRIERDNPDSPLHRVALTEQSLEETARRYLNFDSRNNFQLTNELKAQLSLETGMHRAHIGEYKNAVTSVSSGGGTSAPVADNVLLSPSKEFTLTTILEPGPFNQWIQQMQEVSEDKLSILAEELNKSSRRNPPYTAQSLRSMFANSASLFGSTRHQQLLDDIKTRLQSGQSGKLIYEIMTTNSSGKYSDNKAGKLIGALDYSDRVNAIKNEPEILQQVTRRMVELSAESTIADASYLNTNEKKFLKQKLDDYVKEQERIKGRPITPEDRVKVIRTLSDTIADRYKDDKAVRAFLDDKTGKVELPKKLEKLADKEISKQRNLQYEREFQALFGDEALSARNLTDEQKQFKADKERYIRQEIQQRRDALLLKLNNDAPGAVQYIADAILNDQTNDPEVQRRIADYAEQASGRPGRVVFTGEEYRELIRRVSALDLQGLSTIEMATAKDKAKVQVRAGSVDFTSLTESERRGLSTQTSAERFETRFGSVVRGIRGAPIRLRSEGGPIDALPKKTFIKDGVLYARGGFTSFSALSGLPGTATAKGLPGTATAKGLPGTATAKGLPGTATYGTAAAMGARRKASVFDIDKTIIQTVTGVGKDWAKATLERGNPMANQLAAIRAAQERGDEIVFLTARPDAMKHETIATLEKLGIKDFKLRMMSKAQGDPRKAPEYKVKAIKELQKDYDIDSVWDDEFPNIMALRREGINVKLPVITNGHNPLVQKFAVGGPVLMKSMLSPRLRGYKKISGIGGRSTSPEASGIMRRTRTGEEFAFKGYLGENSELFTRSQSQMNNILKEMGFNVPEATFGAFNSSTKASYIKTRRIKNLEDVTPEALSRLSVDDVMQLQALEAMSNSTDAHLGQMMLSDGRPVFLDRGRGMISQAHGPNKGFISSWEDRPSMLQALRINLGLDKAKVVKHSGADALRLKILQENMTKEQLAETMREQFLKGIAIPEEKLYSRVMAGEMSTVGKQESMELARLLSNGTSEDLTRVMIQRQRQEIEEVLSQIDNIADEVLTSGMNFRSSEFLKGDFAELAKNIPVKGFSVGGQVIAKSIMRSIQQSEKYYPGSQAILEKSVMEALSSPSLPLRIKEQKSLLKTLPKGVESKVGSHKRTPEEDVLHKQWIEYKRVKENISYLEKTGMSTDEFRTLYHRTGTEIDKALEFAGKSVSGRENLLEQYLGKNKSFRRSENMESMDEVSRFDTTKQVFEMLLYEARGINKADRARLERLRSEASKYKSWEEMPPGLQALIGDQFAIHRGNIGAKGLKPFAGGVRERTLDGPLEGPGYYTAPHLVASDAVWSIFGGETLNRIRYNETAFERILKGRGYITGVGQLADEYARYLRETGKSKIATAERLLSSNPRFKGLKADYDIDTWFYGMDPDDKFFKFLKDRGYVGVNTTSRPASGTQINWMAGEEGVTNKRFIPRKDSPVGYKNGGVIFGHGMNSGGKLNGYGGGDKVPAMLEPGEFIINKKSSSKYGGLLTAINQDRKIPGYSKAGQVGDGGAVPGTKSTDGKMSFNQRMGGGMSAMMNAAFLPMTYMMTETMDGFIKQITLAVVAIQGLALAAQLGSMALGGAKGLAAARANAGAAPGFMNAMKGQGAKTAFTAAKSGGASTLSALGTAAGVATGPILVATAAVVGIAAAYYLWNQRLDNLAKTSRSFYQEATEMAKVYNIELNTSKKALEENRKYAQAYGLVAKTTAGKGQVDKDYAAAVTKDYESAIDALKGMNSEQDKANRLASIYASLITQGFSKSQAKEITEEIARQSQSTQALATVYPKLDKAIQNTEDALQVLDTTFAYHMSQLTDVREKVSALAEAYERVQAASAIAPGQSVITTENLVNATANNESGGDAVKDLVRSQLAGAGSSENEINKILRDLSGESSSKDIDWASETGKELATTILSALNTGMTPEDISDAMSLETLQLQVTANVSIQEGKIAVNKELENRIKMTQKAIDKENQKYDDLIGKVEEEKEAIQEAHKKKMEAFDKEREALQERADLIQENADLYIKMLQKEYETEQYYQQQRENAAGGLQSLAQGDIFGFVKSQMKSASDMEQFGREQAIQQIEDTRDKALAGIDSQLKANDKAANALQDATEDQLQGKDDEIEALNKARSAKIKELKDVIDLANEIINNPEIDAKKFKKFEKKFANAIETLSPEVQDSIGKVGGKILDVFSDAASRKGSEVATALEVSADAVTKRITQVLGTTKYVADPSGKSMPSLTWELPNGIKIDISNKKPDDAGDVLDNAKEQFDFQTITPGNIDKVYSPKLNKLGELLSYDVYTWNSRTKKYTLSSTVPKNSFDKRIHQPLVDKDKYKQYFNKGGKVLKLNAGNIVPGFGNTDTVPAMLTPGEFIVNKQATMENLSLLKKINSGQYSMPSGASYDKLGGTTTVNSVNMPVNININGTNLSADQVANKIYTEMARVKKSFDSSLGGI